MFDTPDTVEPAGPKSKIMPSLYAILFALVCTEQQIACQLREISLRQMALLLLSLVKECPIAVKLR
jgi:hypothetical protein